MADTIAEKTANLVADLERPRDPVLSTVTTLRTLAPAAVPTTPASPNLKVDVLVGAVIGTILGLSVAVVRRSLDRSVRTREALEELTGLPLLGTIPYDKPSRRTPSLIPDRPHGQVAEAVRQLRVNIRSAGTGSCTSLLVTSAVAGEGKTSLVCNLAAAFGLEGDRVLLIDADLRRPSVGNYLGINPTSGLSAVLLGERQPHDAVESWRNGLFDVLTSGPIPENPSELLGSKRTSVMLTELESRYDVVLIDSPALLPVADGSVLARACDAALLVVRTAKHLLRKSRMPSLNCVQYLRACLAAHSLWSRSQAAPSDHVPITLRFRKRTASGAGAPSPPADHPYEEVRHPERSERAWNEVLETGEVIGVRSKWIPTGLLHSIRMPPGPNTTGRLWIRSDLVRVPWLQSTRRTVSCFGPATEAETDKRARLRVFCPSVSTKPSASNRRYT